jgi:uncharacterized protein YcbK (DUF882 family)
MVSEGVGRRLVLGAGLIALTASKGWAQTLLEASPSSGQGWSPPSTAPQPQVVARSSASAAAQGDWRRFLLAGERSILMRRAGEGPSVRVRYCLPNGTMDSEGYAFACRMLRDVRANRIALMDPQLLDLLCGMQRWMEYYGRHSVIDIDSGFRTIRTNSRQEGAALNSMHLYGKAADIVIAEAGSGMLGAMAKQFNVDGGTGIYPGRGFVHVDTGRARTWVGKPPEQRRG